MDSQHQQLKISEQSALRRWTGRDHVQFQAAARGEQTGVDGDHALLIAAAQRVDPIPVDVLATRCTTISNLGLLDHERLPVLLPQRGYLALTLHSKGVPAHGCKLKLHALIAKGTPALAPNGLSYYPHQREILLPPGRVIRVQSMARLHRQAGNKRDPEVIVKCLIA